MKTLNADTASSNRLTIWQTVASVLWAFYGVQSEKNRQRDFANGNPVAFIAVGIGLTALFVLSLIGVVHFLIANTAST